MSRAQRDKGAQAEREVAAILQDSLGRAVRRKLGAARDGGDDIQVGRFRIEVKRQERLQIDTWSAQAESNAGPGEVPLLIYRRSREPWRVSLRLDEFVEIMREVLDQPEAE